MPTTHKRLVFANVRVLDTTQGVLTAPMDVSIKDTTIESVTPHDPQGKFEDAQVIQGEGRTLSPGLIDIHCHVESSSRAPWDPGLPIVEQNLERLLFAGVTRAFDPGARVPEIFELRQKVERGDIVGPSIHTTGPMFTAVGGHPVPMFEQLLPGPVANYIVDHQTRQIADKQQANDAIASLAQQGADFIKLTVDAIPLEAPRLTPELAQAIVEGAKKQKLRTVAHIGTTSDAMFAAKAGVHAWVHGVYKETIPDKDISTLASFNIPMAPTLVVFRAYSKLGRGTFQPTDLERAFIPASQLEALKVKREEGEAQQGILEFLNLLHKQQESALSNVKRLHDAGVTILAGSDAQTGVFHGSSLHRELQLLRDAGLTAKEVALSVTYENAKFLANSQDPPYGIVAKGKVADLILVRGNPLEDTKAFSNIDEVVVRGERMKRIPLTQ